MACLRLKTNKDSHLFLFHKVRHFIYLKVPTAKIRYYKDVTLCENYVRDFFIAAILPVSVKLAIDKTRIVKRIVASSAGLSKGSSLRIGFEKKIFWERGLP